VPWRHPHRREGKTRCDLAFLPSRAWLALGSDPRAGRSLHEGVKSIETPGSTTGHDKMDPYEHFSADNALGSNQDPSRDSEVRSRA
jgi:hypothetical protein